jgi:hypothetical protein
MAELDGLAPGDLVARATSDTTLLGEVASTGLVQSFNGLVLADDAGDVVALDDVCRLEGDEARGDELGAGERLRGPLPVGAAVEHQRDEHRRVADGARLHRRSASRAARIDSAPIRTPVTSTRARALAMTSSTGGRDAVSINMPRRYSCRDWPARAARPASSSRTESGTSRTVMATLLLPL